MNDVAVVIPARNAAETIAKALKSVLAAPGVGEVIVVDDGSTDGTSMMVSTFDDARIRTVNGPQTGVSGALNAGFDAVSLPFVARCDADDYIPRDRFEWQRPWLDEHDEAVAVSGGFSSVSPTGEVAAELACTGAPRDVAALLRKGETVTHFCAWLTRMEAIRATGGARTWFGSAEDLDMQFRLAELGPIWHVPKSSYFYRLHATSITHRSSRTLLEFYDRQARNFALQRREGGSDCLQRGVPPELPPISPEDSALSPEEQALGHLMGQAWQEYASGRLGPGYRRLHISALRRPWTMRLWHSVVMINLKVLGRSLRRLFAARSDRL